jgi:hypothetical protein
MKTKKKFKILEDEIENDEKIKKEELQKNLQQELLNKYVEQLDSTELEAIEIAKRILQSSFCLEKSIGYLEFQKLKD